MFLHSFYTPGLSINSYLVGDTGSKRAIIVDPTRDIEPYMSYAKKEGFEITDIAETHVHADFVSGSKELKQQLQNKPLIYASVMGGEDWTPKYVDKPVKNGDEIDLGSICLKAIHTPGHTPEHLIWVCFDKTRSKDTPCLAFTGDLLFVGSVGRPDLLGKEKMENLVKQLHHSLFVDLANLPDFLEIFPAHGAGSLCGKSLSARPSSTLGYERRYNPFFATLSMDQWIEKVEKDIPEPPINFQRIKKMNVQGPILKTEEADLNKKALLVIDIRNPEIFAKAHLKNSINVPFGGAFCNWIGMVLAENIPITVVSDNLEQLIDVVKQLRLIGFDKIVEQLYWNEDQLKDQFEIVSISLISVEEVNTKSYILDVRTMAEWRMGHIEGAHHIELSLLAANINTIPKEAPINVICGSGYRSSVAASFLKTQGYANVANIRGGMSAWNKRH